LPGARGQSGAVSVIPSSFGRIHWSYEFALDFVLAPPSVKVAADRAIKP
jgi:hypothetical protein